MNTAGLMSPIFRWFDTYKIFLFTSMIIMQVASLIAKVGFTNMHLQILVFAFLPTIILAFALQFYTINFKPTLLGLAMNVWRRHFAWFPIKTEEGWTWLRSFSHLHFQEWMGNGQALALQSVVIRTRYPELYVLKGHGVIDTRGEEQST